MKVLKVIHGYPPLYNAGSEVYSQTLCRQLAKCHTVHVFTREDNPYRQDFTVRRKYDGDVLLHLINISMDRNHYSYQIPAVDLAFSKLLEDIKPDVVHIGHLNHLSTSLVYQASLKKIPIVYTLHDYWLMCPRGQFLQRDASSEKLWALCDGQENSKCASRCFAGYFSGSEQEHDIDLAYWSDWIGRRMDIMRDICMHIAHFIAPSKYLLDRYVTEFAVRPERISYLDYGFTLSRFHKRIRHTEPEFVFGYIGTHIPAKGIDYLIQAFSKLHGKTKLRIWGRNCGQATSSLKRLANAVGCDNQLEIEWCDEYNNENIVSDVFNWVDCIVVPSIWAENSPLVIHEALQAKVPIITANYGGMAEYIYDGINGLLFNHRDVISLSEKMQKLINDPNLGRELAQRGYLSSETGSIPDVEQHAAAVTNIYQQVIATNKALS